jgi:hypothetical protein
VSVQIADRLGQAGVMGLEDRPAGGRIPEAVEDRDALGRPQDYIKAWHGVTTMRTTQQLAGRWVPALEHGLEPRRRCFALQPEAPGAGAVPLAWTLAVAGQIRLVVGGQLAGVVLLPPHRELGDVGHHPAAPSRLRWRQQRTPGALLSSERFGWSVDRDAGGQVLWRVHPRAVLWRVEWCRYALVAWTERKALTVLTWTSTGVSSGA